MVNQIQHMLHIYLHFPTLIRNFLSNLFNCEEIFFLYAYSMCILLWQIILTKHHIYPWLTDKLDSIYLVLLISSNQNSMNSKSTAKIEKNFDWYLDIKWSIFQNNISLDLFYWIGRLDSLLGSTMLRTLILSLFLRLMLNP